MQDEEVDPWRAGGLLFELVLLILELFSFRGDLHQA